IARAFEPFWRPRGGGQEGSSFASSFMVIHHPASGCSMSKGSSAHGRSRPTVAVVMLVVESRFHGARYWNVRSSTPDAASRTRENAICAAASPPRTRCRAHLEDVHCASIFVYSFAPSSGVGRHQAPL